MAQAKGRLTFHLTPIILGVIFVLAPLPAYSQFSPKGPQSELQYWLSASALLGKTDRRSIMAHEVFQKTLAAADKRPGPQPALYLLDEDGYPWARSLADGSILLTRGAIDVCLKTSSVKKAEARLAFVIGHELSHQVNGDFWHFFFYQGTHRPTDGKGAGKDDGLLSELVKIAQKSDSVLSKELKADQYGALYASLAGYDVRAIIESGSDFFAQWAAATSPALLEGRSATHPEREQRIAAVELALVRVAEKIEIFEKGVASYQRGGYALAKHYFEEFLSVFQSREAYNNLGLVYFQMASKEYGLFTGEPEKLFSISLVIDTQTRAMPTKDRSHRRMMLTGEDHHTKYKRYSDTAEGYFIEASRRDHTYAPAHNNLACVYFMGRQFAAAVGELDKAIELSGDTPEFYNNRALAFFNLGNSLSVDLTHKTEADLIRAIELDSGYIEAIYNLAAFYQDRGMKAKGDHYAKLLKKKAPNSPLLGMLD
jgi:tetratricopeptide (TPR) repeat protein